MKLRLLFLLSCALSISYTSSAQLVGDNTFLSGKWLQVAIAPNGSWGNTITPPAGYYTHGSASTYADPVTHTSPASGMDFSYDWGHDGFTVGTDPWYGSFFLPGTPFDGWSIQVNGARSDAYYTDFPSSAAGYYNSTTDSLKGSTDSFVAQNGGCQANPNRQIGIWHGSAGPGGKLHITQANILDTLASWLKVNTRFVNTSTDTMHGLYYFVSADPDDDVPEGGSYSTDNHINYQGDGENRHVVMSVSDPITHPHAVTGLGTKDCRAKAMIYGSWPPSTSTGNNLDLVWAGTATAMGDLHYGLYESTIDRDIAYGLIFNLGDLAPGDSTSLSFAWLFTDSSAVDSAFPELSPKIVTEGAGHGNTDSVFGCTMSGCGISGTSFTVNIPGAEEDDWAGSTWTWAPATGITSSLAKGSTVTIDMMGLSGPTVFTVTGTKDTAHGQCNTTSGSKIFYLYAQPCFHATSNIPCLGDTLYLDGHGDSTGATYIWSGPAGYSSIMQYAYVYPTTWADTGTYRLIKTVGSDHDTVYTHATIRPLPLVTAGTNAPICSQTTLLLTSTAYVGTGETYSWTGPNAFTSALQNTSRINAPVKDEGMYKVVTSLGGCKDSAYINVVIDTTPALPTITSNAPICSHRDTLYFTSSDVTPGVSYSWTGPNGFTSLLQNPKIVADVSTLYTGIYAVTATYATCSNTNTLNVLVDKTPDRPVPVTNAPVCSGNTLTMGATSDAGSTYNWVGPNGFASGFQDPLITPVTMAATGIYSVTATIFYPGITMGCISDTITLNVIIDSMVTAGFTYQIHYGCVADTIAFTNNSTIATRFLWEFGDGTSSGDVNPAHVYTVQNYDTVVLSSSAGVCVATQRQIINDVHPLNAAFTSDSTIICQGRTINFTDGSVSTGGSYLWSFGDGATSLTASPSHTFTKAGVYNVFEVVTDFIPCRDTARETVYIDSLSPVFISLTDPALCQSTYITVTGDYSSIGNTGIVWNFGDGDSVKNTNPVSYAYSTPGTYTISATALYRVCADATATKTITIEPQPTINLGADQSICKGSDIITLADGTNSSTSGATWLWSTGQTTSSIVITDPGTYTATVTIDGCSASSSVNVTNDCYMNIPNVFTPNGDGLNDYFFPRQALTSGLTSFSIVIYNRWGTKVFESNSLTGAGWDGKLGGVDQPEDVYIYIIDGTFKDGQKEHHQGNVTLLR